MLPNSNAVLSRGQLFGSPTGTLHLEEAVLTETRYSPRTRLPRHAHELPMFVFVVDGSFDESFGRHDRTCGPARLIFRPAGESHEQVFLDRGCACLTMELPSLGERALDGADGRLDLAGVPAMLAMRIYDEFARPTTETALVVEEALVHLVDAADKRAHVTERRTPDWLAVALELIDTRLSQRVQLAEIARQVGVHRVHISRTFARLLGCNVAEYVRRRRVHQACRGIRAGGQSMSAIAIGAGFSDESHMGRAFREVLGRTPGSYRATRV